MAFSSQQKLLATRMSPDEISRTRNSRPFIRKLLALIRWQKKSWWRIISKLRTYITTGTHRIITPTSLEFHVSGIPGLFTWLEYPVMLAWCDFRHRVSKFNLVTLRHVNWWHLRTCDLSTMLTPLLKQDGTGQCHAIFLKLAAHRRKFWRRI